MMKIVLTGSRGGIGKAIKKKLEEENTEIICLNSDEFDFQEKISVNLSDISGLVHCAGINETCSYKKINRDSARKIMDVNTFSFLELCAQIKFKNGANIIAIGSLYSTETNTHRAQYTMSKHALFGAVKTLAMEMAPAKVNLVSPGFVDTPMTRKNNSAERIAELESKTPLGLTKSDDIAEMCHYLLTKNRCITGQNIVIDSGYSLIGV